MKKILLLILNLFYVLLVSAQIQLSQWQTFQWDSLNDQQFQSELPFERFPKLFTTVSGFVIGTNWWEDYPNRLNKEFHYFDSNMQFHSTKQRGIVFRQTTFGNGEDFFADSNYIYAFDRMLIENDSSSLIAMVFTKSTLDGEFISSDTLLNFYGDYYDGNYPSLALKNRVISNGFVYYIMKENVSNSINVIKINLAQPEFNFISIDSSLDLVSFLGIDSGLINIECVRNTGSILRYFINQYSLEGELIDSSLVGEFVDSGTFIKDYIYNNDSLLVAIRYKGDSERHFLEFYNDNFEVEASIDLHGNEANSSPIIQANGSNTIFLVQEPVNSNINYYKLIEVDLTTKSIVADTLFQLPIGFETFTPSIFVNHENGDVVFYTFGSNIIPYFHRINVFEKKAYFDDILLPQDSIFSECRYFDLAVRNGEYYLIALDNAITGEGLSSYCFGKLDFSTSLISSSNLQTQIILSPNPTSYQLHVSRLPPGILQIRILDLYGRVLDTQTSNQINTIQLSIENLNIGVYFVSVQSKNGVQTKKFIKT